MHALCRPLFERLVLAWHRSCCFLTKMVKIATGAQQLSAWSKPEMRTAPEHVVIHAPSIMMLFQPTLRRSMMSCPIRPPPTTPTRLFSRSYACHTHQPCQDSTIARLHLLGQH